MQQTGNEAVFAVKILEQGASRPGSALIELRSDGMALRRSSAESIVLYSELELRLGAEKGTIEIGFPEGAVVFAASDRALVRAVRRCPSARLRDGLQQALEELRPAYQSVARGALTAVLAFAVTLFICQGIFSALRMALLWCPPSWEMELGRAAYALHVKPTESDNPVLKAAVEKVAAPLLKALPAHDFEIEIHVSTSSQVNAVAYPGGQIVLYSGLIAEAKSPEELAGIIAHQISHVMLRHSLKALTRRLRLSQLIAAIPLDLANGRERFVRLAHELGTLRYSRAQEQEADLGGGALLKRAGISPEGMAEFFRRTAKDESAKTAIYGFLGAHPLGQERAAYLDVIAMQNPAQPIRFDLDWESVRKEAGLKQGDPYHLGRASLRF